MFRSLRQLTLLSKYLHRIRCQNDPERENIHLVSPVTVCATEISNQLAMVELAFFFFDNVVQSCNFKQLYNAWY